MSTIDQSVAHYVARLIYQYQRQKAQDTIAILAAVGLVNELPFAIQDGYDPATAVGAQLDVIGKYVGLPRGIGEATPADYFGFVDYAGGGNENGFSDYDGGVNPDGLMYDYTYYGTRNTDLSDKAYAFMIALKIILNSNDGTLSSIQQLIADLIPHYVTLVDNRNMTLTYSVALNAPVAPSVISPYLPKPMGVGVEIKTFVFLGAGADDVVTSDGDNVVIGQ